MKPRRIPSRWFSISLLGTVVVAVANSPAMNLWWAWDDMHYLVTILRHSPSEYFFDPQFWQHSQILFTPLNILPYEINYFLFGAQPSGFYLHQLLAAWLLFLATQLFLRLWCSLYWSLAGASLVLFSAPVLITVYQLMCVHYLEGLLFSVLAVYLYVESLRGEKRSWTLPGAGLYLLACAAKEIFVPLAFCLPLIPEGTFRQRIRYSLAYLLAFVVYLVWRYSQLGLFVSGYGVPVSLTEAASIPLVSVAAIAGGGLPGALGGLIYLSLLLFAMVRWRLSPLFVFGLLLLLVLPLVPIASRMDSVDRAQVLIAWVLCVSLTILLARISRAGRRATGLSVLLFMTVSIGIVRMTLSTRDWLIHDNQRFRTVGEYVMSEPSSHALLLTGNDLRAREAKQLRGLLQGETGPTLLYDPKQLSAMGAQYDAMHWFDPERGQMVDLSDPAPAFLQEWSRRTEDRPLSLEMKKRDGVVSWQFKPYRDANYDVVFLSTAFAFTDVNHVGRYLAPIPAMDFVLRYQSPEGWITYSDVLHWDSVEGETLTWSRASTL